MGGKAEAMPNTCSVDVVKAIGPDANVPGTLIVLEPLVPAHADELLLIATDQSIWQFTTSNASTKEALDNYVSAALRDRAEGTAAPFVVRWRKTGALVGWTRLKDYSAEHRRVAIGSWFSPAVWGLGANPESKLLVLTLAFEQLQCQRVEFRSDRRNARSRAALKAIGAVEEGILRSYAETGRGSGIRRDDVVHSLLREEWPASKQRLLDRIARIVVSATAPNFAPG
jgi:N-acetyltransferase